MWDEMGWEGSSAGGRGTGGVWKARDDTSLSRVACCLLVRVVVCDAFFFPFSRMEGWRGEVRLATTEVTHERKRQQS